MPPREKRFGEYGRMYEGGILYFFISSCIVLFFSFLFFLFLYIDIITYALVSLCV